MADYLGYERAFKNAGITYTIEPGAYDRGHGDLAEVKFIVIHHTAGGNDDGDIRIVRDGRAGLPGPLSQIVLKRNGQPHIVAVGVCYHAPGAIKYRNVPAGSGNWYSIGIEGVSNGYNDWTDAQRREYPRVVAALLKDMGLPSDAWIFHRDYQPGEKIDPGGFTKEWFASEVNKHYNGTAKPIETAIQAKRRLSPWLGKKTTATEELATPDGIGRFTYYENGAIYWTPSTGACALSNEMVDRYSKAGYEAGELGYPTTDVFSLPDGKGRAQAFQNGSIYWTEETDAQIVKGRIGAKWAEYGWEKSLFGYPVGEEEITSDGVGRVQRFQNGKIYWQSSTDAHPVYGLIGEAYDRNDTIKNLGYPKTDEGETQDGHGRYQKFEFGTIYWKKGRDTAYVVLDEFMDQYGRQGYEIGRLGYPTADHVAADGNKKKQHFEGGDITLDSVTKEVWLYLDGEQVKV